MIKSISLKRLYKIIFKQAIDHKGINIVKMTTIINLKIKTFFFDSELITHVYLMYNLMV